MNQRIVLGLLIAGGLGIGLFAAVERVMRGAGRQVTTIVEAPRELEKPVELVSAPAKKPEMPLPAVVRKAPVVPVAGFVPPVQAVVGKQPEPLLAGPVVDKLAVCANVKDRNPVGEAASFRAGSGRVSCWMRVSSAAGKKVRPVWTMNGKVSAGPWIAIPATPFRTWATRRIDRTCAGDAKVEIQDEKGAVLAVQEFSITK